MSIRALVASGLALVVGVGVAARRRAKRRAVSWADPGPPAAPLTPDTLARRVSGSGGVPVLLLHGMLGSSRFWGADYDQLGSDGRLIVVDLLGFGSSPRPDGRYGLDDHVDALLATLDGDGIDDAVVIGAHSLGCVIALGLAQQAPERVAGIVMFGQPIYTSPVQARARMSALGGLSRLLALDTPLAERVCRWMCQHRSLAARLAVVLRPDLPKPVARDSVQHNWVSYAGTMRNVIIGSDSAGLARRALNAMAATEPLNGHRPDVTLRIIAGDRDTVPEPAVLDELATDPAVRVECWQGRHDLPLREPKRCIRAIAAMRARGASVPHGYV